MSLYETLLFVHVASAFAFVASYVGFSVALVAGSRTHRTEQARALLRLVAPAGVLAWIGATGTLVFGVWLTVDVDGYELWDGWIAGALLVWLVTEEAIRREDLVFRKARRAARAALPQAGDSRGESRAVLRSRRTLLLHFVGGAGMLALVALMIFKPGAS